MDIDDKIDKYSLLAEELRNYVKYYRYQYFIDLPASNNMDLICKYIQTQIESILGKTYVSFCRVDQENISVNTIFKDPRDIFVEAMRLKTFFTTNIPIIDLLVDGQTSFDIVVKQLLSQDNHSIESFELPSNMVSDQYV